jgi:hypothetical protein
MEASRVSAGVTVAWSTSPQAMATDRWERTSGRAGSDPVVVKAVLARASGPFGDVARHDEPARLSCWARSLSEGECARLPAEAR